MGMASLLATADEALYAAKAAGRGTFKYLAKVRNT
jgi:PleD family two-component response regulator